jgi:hypothetical protein
MMMGAAGWVEMIFVILIWIAIIVGLVFLSGYLFFRPYGGRHGDWHGHHPGDPHGPGPGGPGAWGGPGGPGTGQEGSPSNALRILEERYARGEIDREEYLQRRADMEHKA